MNLLNEQVPRPMLETARTNRDNHVPPTPPAGTGVDSAYAWLRLTAAVCSHLGSVGMWSVPVALPAVQADFRSRARTPRCPLRSP